MPFEGKVDISTEGLPDATREHPEETCLHRERFSTALNETFAAFGRTPMSSVARRIAVSEAAVSHWRSGQRIPSERNLTRLHGTASQYRTPLIPLRELVQLRLEAHCSPLLCSGARPQSKGDRRNTDAGQPVRTGDRRNGSGTVGANFQPTASGGSRSESASTADWLHEMTTRASRMPTAEIMAIAGKMLSAGHGHAARVLLSVAAGRPGDMVDMMICALKREGPR
ncbi:hypothetical protein ACIA8O_28480 [Kitasatospora sp. NPDC051853]|uniref:hypothetical protein n=1 Tax=Kitasatospora sp. NPDC051853 TaxID=3364058 RepID=UPI0037A2AD36